MSSKGVLETFGEHSNEVTVEAVHKKKYRLGKHAGKLGEMVKKKFQCFLFDVIATCIS